jgi:PRTRC genetic system protein D
MHINPTAELRGLGIDVGFGHTKYPVSEIVHDVFSDRLTLKTSSFPSLCAPVLQLDQQSVTGLSDSRESRVEIEAGQAFIVGDDAALEDAGGGGRALHAGYTNSLDYEVFVKSVLQRRLHPAAVHKLVLGVPVNAARDVVTRLTSRFTGELYVDGHEVTVHNTKVIEQPTAAFVWHVYAHGQQKQIQGRITLVIDIGYRTVDWLVVSGLKLIASRSGSSPGGRVKNRQHTGRQPIDSDANRLSKCRYQAPNRAHAGVLGTVCGHRWNRDRIGSPNADY